MFYVPHHPNDLHPGWLVRVVKTQALADWIFIREEVTSQFLIDDHHPLSVLFRKISALPKRNPHGSKVVGSNAVEVLLGRLRPSVPVAFYKEAGAPKLSR